ncbi:MAG: hypothetical protein FJY11_07145 [Bacteroidetes bacterium]|nr:hypothetical protein [Bacteroidota bacterium]
MEEERGLGNIVFYIIAAVIAIISSIKGKKKPVPGSPGGGPPPERKGGGFPDDMFEDEESEFPFPPTTREERTAPPPVFTARRKPTQEMVPGREGSYEEPMAAAHSGEGVSALDYIETARRFDELLRETSTVEYNWSIESEREGMTEAEDKSIELITEDFDGRKAVIYSEVLSRREY